MEKTEEGNLIEAGDFNARMRQGSIVGYDEVHKRKSKDRNINKERNILNDNLEGDEEGEHTYIGPRGE